jgi:hypothetical protein
MVASYLFYELFCVQVRTSSHQKNTIVPMSTFGCGQITHSTHPEPLSPRQPLANNNDGTGMQLEELAISLGGSSAFVDSFVDKFVALLGTADFGDCDGILDNAAPLNPTDSTPLLGRSLFNDGEEEMSPFAMGTVNKSAVPGVNFASFPSNFGMGENCFTNQDEALNDEGYNSKGNLPHFADKPNDNMEDYCEETIAGGGGCGGSSGSGGTGGSK